MATSIDRPTARWSPKTARRCSAKGAPSDRALAQSASAADGTIRTGTTVAGRLQIVDFPDYQQLTREGAARFRAADPSAATPTASGLLRAGALEKSNVSMVERIAEMTEVTRTFEALQKGVSVLMNDIDGKAISELGRR